MPEDTDFPFLMSAYSIDPRPENIRHENGATEVSRLEWGANESNRNTIAELTDDKRLVSGEDKGFRKIIIDGWESEILNKPYYK